VALYFVRSADTAENVTPVHELVLC